ncbi:hypothetical protein KJ815_08550, partial [bacterium]|nr:hypothetical protein [bacterium]
SLELLKMLFRDVALRRLGETPLTFRESEKVLDGILKAFPQADIDAAVQIVDECMNHLARGYTENFSLFTLAIRLRDCLGPRTAVKRATSRTVDV